MKICKLLLVISAFVFSVSAKAAIVWSWSFEQSVIEVGPDDLVELNVVVTNDISSDATLYISALDFPSLGSDYGFMYEDIGFIYNSNNDLMYIPTILAPPADPSLAPGESVTYTAAGLHPESLIGGESVYLDPLFWVKDYPGNNIIGFLPGQSSTNGLQINITSVPLPAAFWLFMSGLLGLIGISKGNVKP